MMRADKCVTIALVLLLSVTGSNAFAKVVADKDWVDALELDTLVLTEDFIATFDSAEYQAAMDSCIQERYVIVEENGKIMSYRWIWTPSCISAFPGMKKGCPAAVSTLRRD